MTSPSSGQVQPVDPACAAASGGTSRAYRLPAGLALWLVLKAGSVILLLFGQPLWAAAVYLVLDPWFLWQVLVARGRGFGPVVSRFKTQDRAVWLTIDDGPDPRSTPAVLDLLDRHDARATFFLIGERARRHPALVAEIVRRGHDIGNHTHTHPCWSFWAAGAARIGSEIDACNRALADAGAPSPRYFRMPVGMKTPFFEVALAPRGMSLVAWSARGFDRTAKLETAVRRIVRSIRPGTIVLLHEAGPEDAGTRVIGQVLQHLSANGYHAILPDHRTLES